MARKCSTRHPACWQEHAQLVEDYRAARLADEDQREAAVGLYGPGSPEWREWASQHSVTTFKDWLIRTTGTYLRYEPA